MSTPSPHVSTCTESLKLLADFWILRIIEALAKEPLRYCEIQRSVGNVNPATLTKKLSKLESAKLIIRTEDKEHAAVSYSLTSLGEHALPVLHAVETFSKKAEKK